MLTETIHIPTKKKLRLELFARFPVNTVFKTDKIHTHTHIYTYMLIFILMTELFMSLIMTVVLEKSRLESWLVMYTLFFITGVTV